MAKQHSNDRSITIPEMTEGQDQPPISIAINPTNIRPGFDEMITEMLERMAESLDYLATR